MRFSGFTVSLVILMFSCGEAKKPTYVITAAGDTVVTANITLPPPLPDSAGHFTRIATKEVTPAQVITFARSLKGIRYKYGSTDPAQGFDCSGFITFVFNHFGIAVPRRSVDFTYVNKQIELKNAKTGDLILFTGTDSTVRIAGHMGIVIAQPGQPLMFIHSTSGKANGVTETPLNAYYQGRYLKTIQIFR
jgi:cell wall-associated NlpC family hydrolase